MIKYYMLWVEKETLEKLVKRLLKILPDRIKLVYVFGSRVRGNHDEWSDLDILVVVKDKKPEIEKKIIDIVAEERFKTGIPFAPIIKDIKVFEEEKRLNTPFYQNLLKEGINLLKEEVLSGTRIKR